MKKHYPNGIYQAVYKSGFRDFSTYYALQAYGIDCLVIHATDVPTTQYETVMKSDPIDPEKLAKALKSGTLQGIYIHRKDNLDDRSIVCIRKIIQKQLGDYKSRVKHLLYTHSVLLPNCFSSPSTHWFKHFIIWLREDVVLLSSSRTSLDLLLK